MMNGINDERIDEIKSLLTDEVAYKVYVINTFNQMHERFKYTEKLLENYTEIIKALTSSINDRLNNQDSALQKCFDELKPKQEGMSGFLDRSWKQFTDKFGWIIILIFLWIILKVVVFGEGPFGKALFHPKPVSQSQEQIGNGIESSDSRR